MEELSTIKSETFSSVAASGSLKTQPLQSISFGRGLLITRISASLSIENPDGSLIFVLIGRANIASRDKPQNVYLGYVQRGEATIAKTMEHVFGQRHPLALNSLESIRGFIQTPNNNAVVHMTLQINYFMN